MANGEPPAIKLSGQLVMTEQLKLALRLLAMPTAELPALVDEWRANHPGTTEPLAIGEPDPFDAEDELGFSLLDAAPLPADPRADVWIYGDPPEVRANGRGFPRLKPIGGDRDASWLVRALRQRARCYEVVVRAMVKLAPMIAVARNAAKPARSTDPRRKAAPPPVAVGGDGRKVEPVVIRAVVDEVGMHESTISRVATSCRLQNAHGLFALAATRRTLGIVPVT